VTGSVAGVLVAGLITFTLAIGDLLRVDAPVNYDLFDGTHTALAAVFTLTAMLVHRTVQWMLIRREADGYLAWALLAAGSWALTSLALWALWGDPFLSTGTPSARTVAEGLVTGIIEGSVFGAAIVWCTRRPPPGTRHESCLGPAIRLDRAEQVLAGAVDEAPFGRRLLV
jgi:hypothetical protein